MISASQASICAGFARMGVQYCATLAQCAAYRPSCRSERMSEQSVRSG